MFSRLPIYLFILLSCLVVSGLAQAEVVSGVEGTMNIGAVPRAVATSADGRYIFVLAEGGTVFIYSTEGKPVEKIEVDKSFDNLAAAPDGSRLLLTNPAQKTVSIIRLDFVQNINTAGSPSQGPANAAVSVVVFSDFQCPYCSKLGPVLAQVRELFPKDVRIIFKNYPLPNHSFANKAAAASLAAHEQGKFWEYHDKLFENSSQLNDQKFEEIAQALNLNMDRFRLDMKAEKISKQIATDLQDGNQAGVRGTPTVFINGRLLRNRSVEGCKEMIDAELAKKRP